MKFILTGYRPEHDYGKDDDVLASIRKRNSDWRLITINKGSLGKLERWRHFRFILPSAQCRKSHDAALCLVVRKRKRYFKSHFIEYKKYCLEHLKENIKL